MIKSTSQNDLIFFNESFHLFLLHLFSYLFVKVKPILYYKTPYVRSWKLETKIKNKKIKQLVFVKF